MAKILLPEERQDTRLYLKPTSRDFLDISKVRQMLSLKSTPLYLWLTKQIKCCIVSIYYIRDYRKKIILLFNVWHDSNFLKNPILVKDIIYIKKVRPTKVEGFQIFLFNRKQNMRNGIYRGVLCLELFRNLLGLYLLKILEWLWSYKKSKY